MEDQTPDKVPTDDRSHLADLYPQAKTLEQRVADKKAAEARQEARRPKHIVVTTMAQLFGLLLGLFAAIHAGQFALGISVLSGVSFSLLLMVLWLACVGWTFVSINRRFAALGVNAAPFLAAYTCLFPASAYALGRMAALADDRLLLAGSLVLLHVLMTLVLMRLLGPRV